MRGSPYGIFTCRHVRETTRGPGCKATGNLRGADFLNTSRRRYLSGMVQHWYSSLNAPQRDGAQQRRYSGCDEPTGEHAAIMRDGLPLASQEIRCRRGYVGPIELR